MENVVYIEKDSDNNKINYLYFKPKKRDTMNLELISKGIEVIKRFASNPDNKNSILIFKRQNGGIFNYGGDLNYFQEKAKENDINSIREYAMLCAEFVILLHSLNSKGIITSSLVDGDAFGGGFELALSTDFIISTNNANFSFPEIEYNFFPGMGGLNLLSRRIGARNAFNFIIGNKLVNAEEATTLGISDFLINDESELFKILNNIQEKSLPILNLMEINQKEFKEEHNSFKNEIIKSVLKWSENINSLNEKQLKKMSIVSKIQEKRYKG